MLYLKSKKCYSVLRGYEMTYNTQLKKHFLINLIGSPQDFLHLGRLCSIHEYTPCRYGPGLKAMVFWFWKDHNSFFSRLMLLERYLVYGNCNDRQRELNLYCNRHAREQGIGTSVERFSSFQ
jgi:hypothetical protein